MYRVKHKLAVTLRVQLLMHVHYTVVFLGDFLTGSMCPSTKERLADLIWHKDIIVLQ